MTRAWNNEKSESPTAVTNYANRNRTNDEHRALRPWENTLSPTQMFPCLPARAAFVADKNFVSGTKKMFLILFRNILCPQEMFPSLRSPRNVMGNNVSATECPRLPWPLTRVLSTELRKLFEGTVVTTGFFRSQL